MPYTKNTRKASGSDPKVGPFYPWLNTDFEKEGTEFFTTEDAEYAKGRMQDGSRTKDCWFPVASLDATVRQRNKPKAAREESKSYEQ
jgi:hypothetical protein